MPNIRTLRSTTIVSNNTSLKPSRLRLPAVPIGVAAWIGEQLKAWSDSDDPIEPAFTKDQVLTDVMVYLRDEHDRHVLLDVSRGRRRT